MSYQARDSLLREEIEKEEIERTYHDFLKIFQEADSYKATEKLQKFTQNTQNIKYLQTHMFIQMNQGFKNRFDGKLVRIDLPLAKINQNDPLIKCKAFVGTHEVDCLSACGHWNRLILNAKEKTSGYVNLLDHLAELLPSKQDGNAQKETIGLFTFQNGINNSWDDFKVMGSSILKNLPENPLCIGFYNPKKGIVNDLLGVNDKLVGLLSDIVCSTLEIFTQLATKLEATNNKLAWVHIAHSEGALIAEMVLTLLHNEKKYQPLRNYFRTHLIALCYRGVLPIPKELCRENNTYSTQDLATWSRVQKFLKEQIQKSHQYTINSIDPRKNRSNLSEAKSPSLGGKVALPSVLIKEFASAVWYYLNGGDHGFQGGTYQQALNKDIDKLRQNTQIYGNQAN